VSGELDLDVEALVAKDLLCFTEDGVGELGMKVKPSNKFILRTRLNNRDMYGLVRIDRPCVASASLFFSREAPWSCSHSSAGAAMVDDREVERMIKLLPDHMQRHRGRQERHEASKL
jgi:hypothetical protein